jgi:hypothetical protein
VSDAERTERDIGAAGLTRRGLDAFTARLAAHPSVWIDTRSLWAAFVSAFPRHPSGPVQRQWLLEALAYAVTQGVVELPSHTGARWDRLATPPVPTSVKRRRAIAARAVPAWRTDVWHPALQWVPAMDRLTEDEARFLRAVHAGLVAGDFDTLAPLKHRSLVLTGDEKRLGDLASGRLFASGRLTLELLGAEREIPPLAWTVVAAAPSPRILVFENAGPSDLAVALLCAMPVPSYHVVVFGGGRPFPSSLVRLIALRPREIAYVGDLDADGVAIAAAAAQASAAAGLPVVRPATGFHAAMLAGAAQLGRPDGWRMEDAGTERGRDPRSVHACAQWLPADVSTMVTHVIESGHRIPEEVLSPAAMRAVLNADAAAQDG